MSLRKVKVLCIAISLLLTLNFVSVRTVTGDDLAPALTLLKAKLLTLAGQMGESKAPEKKVPLDENQIFKALKTKLEGTDKTAEQVANSPDEVVTTAEEINFTLKSQSLNHIRSYYKKESIDQNTLNTLLEATKKRGIILAETCETTWGMDVNKNYVSNIDLLPIYKVVSKVLANEISLKKDYYVFYHAHEPRFRIMFDTYQQLYRWGFFRQNQQLALRLIKPVTMENAQNLLNEFLQQALNLKREHNRYTLEGESNEQFDGISKVSARILSANLSLFGNMGSFGDSSMILAMSGISFSKAEPEERLSQIFKENNIDEKFAKQLADLGKDFFSKQQSGFLLQFFIKKNVVDHVAYLSNDGGRPFSDEKKKRTFDDISKFLTSFIDTPETLAQELTGTDPDQEATKEETHIGAICPNQFKRNLDEVQARLWLPAKELYDPDSVMIKRYNFTSTQKTPDGYYEKLNDIIDNIIKDLIHKYRQNSDLFKETPFQGLIKEINKCSSSTQKLVENKSVLAFA